MGWACRNIRGEGKPEDMDELFSAQTDRRFGEQEVSDKEIASRGKGSAERRHLKKHCIHIIVRPFNRLFISRTACYHLIFVRNRHPLILILFQHALQFPQIDIFYSYFAHVDNNTTIPRKKQATPSAPQAIKDSEPPPSAL
jgi:hypothetical protein